MVQKLGWDSFCYVAAFIILVVFFISTLYLMWACLWYEDEDEIINEEMGMIEAKIRKKLEQPVKKCYDLQRGWQWHEIYWLWYEDETVV